MEETGGKKNEETDLEKVSTPDFSNFESRKSAHETNYRPQTKNEQF